MSSIFTSAQWDKIKTDSDLWWARELGRPLIQFRLAGAPTTAKKPAHPFYEFTSFYDMSVTPEQVVDAWEYSLLTTEHLGDAYPSVRPNFGPGSIGA